MSIMVSQLLFTVGVFLAISSSPSIAGKSLFALAWQRSG